MKFKRLNVKALQGHIDMQLAELSDYILLMRFKGIRYQCKWLGRGPNGALIDYINELEFRRIKYRL